MTGIISVVLSLLTAAALLGVSAAGADPLVLDKKSGHYKDLSYEALSDEGLSLEQRSWLFGGETVHYGPLTDAQRKAKKKELQALLAKIDVKLVAKCKTGIRTWLDGQAKAIPPAYAGRDVSKLRTSAVAFFRAYESFGDKKYLDAGLKCADRILAKQWPKGHWPWGGFHEDFVRIQDGFNDWPFWIMLYAHKVSGDKKYFESAKRCADVLLTMQRRGGGWPDQHTFSGRGTPHTGVRHGISFNDNPTNSSFQMMVMMYHMTGDKKYIANLHKLGAFLAKAKMGEGNVAGWCAQYHDDGRPVRARQYEIEVINPSTLMRGVGPLLIWLYLMDGDGAHMDLLRRAYAWHETVRRKELEPWQLEAWEAMSKAYAHPKWGRQYYRPGWPDGVLPDGSNWGRCLYFKIIPWYPVTPEMKKKYGNKIHSSETDAGSRPGKIGYLADWAKVARSGGKIPFDRMGGLNHNSRGNSLSEIRRALLEHKRGGRKGMLTYYSGPTKYTPDQYLQVRVDAAKRALDARNVRRAADSDKGILACKDAAALIFQKPRWHGGAMRDGKRITKWGRAFGTNVAWYQWQFVYDTMLAQGKINADAAARGGRGLESFASMTHLDSWDVLGDWGMACHEKENHFDVPLGGDKAQAQVRRFDAKTPQEAKQWQSECRRGLARGLKLEGFLAKRTGAKITDPLNVKVLTREERAKYTLYKIALDVTPGWRIPALLTVPNAGDGPFRGVVFVEGAMEYVYPEGKLFAWSEYVKNRSLKDGALGYGAVLAEKGYVTIAADCLVASPLAPDFKKRPLLTHPGTPDYARDQETYRRSNSTERFQIGVRLVDYLCSRKDVNAGRIGVVGLCKWGAAACQLAALDPRIKAVVSSCTLMRDGKKVPWRFAGPDQPPFDLLDLYGLIAPRPILCQFGEKDGYRPAYPTEAELKDVRRRYGILGGRPKDLVVFWHPGKHIVEQSSMPGFFGKALAN